MCCHICPRGQDCRRNHGKTRTKRQEAGAAGWGGGDFNSYPAAVPRIVMSTTDKNGANLSLETFIFAISRSIDPSIDVALILIPDRCTKKREKKSLRAARVHMPARVRVRVRPSTRKNERASERAGYISPNGASWAVRFHLGRTTPHPHPIPCPFPSHPADRPIRACPACLSPSICLSVCPRTHCALRIPIWAAGPGLAFSEAGVPSRPPESGEIAVFAGRARPSLNIL